jgi:hypothetical protein
VTAPADTHASLARRAFQLAIALLAMLALSATVFSRQEGVDPRGVLIAMGLVAASVPVARVVRALPLEHDHAPRLGARAPSGDADRGLPSALVVWRGRVNGGTTSARAATLRLVPALQELTALRLADRRGIASDHTPAAAAAALGAVAWSLVDPAVARPVEGNWPGIPLDTLDHLVTTLEHL